MNPIDCTICDRRQPLDADGLCADCRSFPALVAAVREGLARKAMTGEKRDAK